MLSHHIIVIIACPGFSELIPCRCSHASASQALQGSDSLCSDSFQLQASGAQFTVQLVHFAVMGDREIPDPSVFFCRILMTTKTAAQYVFNTALEHSVFFFFFFYR